MSSKTKTTIMKEEAKPRLVPKLRFPEFRGAEGWKQTPLEHCLDYLQPTPFLVTDTNYSPGYKTPVLTAGKTFILGYTNEQHGVFSEGLPVIIFDDFTTATQFVDFPFKAKSSAMKILQAKNGADIKFMFETLQTLGYEVGAHERHWISNFAPMLVPIPKPAEQQKIAECLSSADELIAAQARKVEALKVYKKGLMQRVFPREGERRPRLRFAEFRNDGEWVVKSLGELFPITSSKRVHESDWTSTGVPFYRAREIVALKKHESIQPLFISEELYDAYSTQTGEIRDGHLLVTGVGSIGVPYLVRTGDRFYFKDGNIIWLKNDGKQLSGEFLHRLYETDYVQKQLSAMADVGTVATYTIENAKRTLAVFPSDEDEQQRITSFLSSLDALIAAEAQKLIALEIHKKGLMQQLFPVQEEVEV